MSETQSRAHEAGQYKLSSFQWRMLTVLSDEARYGLAIKRQLEDYYGEDINHGRLYPNLDSLVEDGLVDKSELDKRTNEYAITDEGQDALTAYLEWTLTHFVTDDERAESIREMIDTATSS